MFVLVEVANVKEVGSLEKVSLSEKVVLLLLTLEVGAVKEGFWILSDKAVFSVVPSRPVPSTRVRVLEAGQR